MFLILQVLNNIHIIYIFNLLLCFTYVQAAFSSDDTLGFYTYLLYMVLPDDGPRRAETFRREQYVIINNNNICNLTRSAF